MFAMSVGAAAVVLPADTAHAVDCNDMTSPKVANDGNFHPFFVHPTVTAPQVLEFAGGDYESATASAEGVVADPNAPADIAAFFADTVTWLQFRQANPCAEPIAYPGPFKVVPKAQNAPYGWDLNPTAAASAYTPDSVPATHTPHVAADDSLAHTGSDVGAFLYLSSGLVAFGALAMGARRRMN